MESFRNLDLTNAQQNLGERVIRHGFRNRLNGDETQLCNPCEKLKSQANDNREGESYIGYWTP